LSMDFSEKNLPVSHLNRHEAFVPYLSAARHRLPAADDLPAGQKQNCSKNVHNLFFSHLYFSRIMDRRIYKNRKPEEAVDHAAMA